MSQHYLRYNTETLIPDCISPTLIADVPAGFAVVEIDDDIANDLKNHVKPMHLHLVSIKSGNVTLVHKNAADLLIKKALLPNNSVQDLDYRKNHVNMLNIKYSYNGSSLLLAFDVEKDYLLKLYITKFRDATKLLATKDVQLTRDKNQIEIPIALADQQISVWGKQQHV